jgi:copper resistance protein C
LLGVGLFLVERSKYADLQKGIAVMRIRAAVASMLFIALGSSVALAHAHLDHASPAVGGTVATSPTEVALFYTQNLEPAFSTVEVTDSGGASVDDGKAQISGNTMRIGLKALGPGSYKVHWHAVSVDTHTTEGTFTFHVGP